jgi:hypothetical protein
MAGRPALPVCGTTIKRIRLAGRSTCGAPPASRKFSVWRQRHEYRTAQRTVTLILVTLLSFLSFIHLFTDHSSTHDRYLQIAWEHTGRDPHILNWREPEVNVLFEEGRILVHFIFHTDQDREIGPYSFTSIHSK